MSSKLSNHCDLIGCLYHMTSVPPPAGVEDLRLVPLTPERRRRTNTATSTGTTAVAMATKVFMETSGRGGLGQRKTQGSGSLKLIGSETRRFWT